MAHELATTNGRAAIAYFGQTPWHGLGVKLDNPATSGEAITAAGLDYEATLLPIQTSCGVNVPHRKAVVRSDTGAVLGVVGKEYAPIQNRKAFAFLDAVVTDGGLR